MEYYLQIMLGTHHSWAVVNFVSNAPSCASSIVQTFSNPSCFLPCKMHREMDGQSPNGSTAIIGTHFEFISFKSAAANALTTALMADSSGLLISSSSFCDIIFGFLPILFNLNTRNVSINLYLSTQGLDSRYLPFGCNGFHSFSHEWVLIQHAIEMVDTQRK